MKERVELLRRIAELEKLETEHKQTIEILHGSENKYKVLLENLPQKIFHKEKLCLCILQQ
jgi:phage shock protein A